MDPYRILVYVHLLASVVFVGLALFWLIMLIALRLERTPAEVTTLLETANGARWPHVAVPWKLRLPLPWFAWAVLAILVGTGLALLQFRGMGANTFWWAKIALVAATALIQLLVTHRPLPPLIQFNFAVVLLIILMSAWMVR